MDLSKAPLEPRPLARLTQTDVTPDPRDAIEYGLLALTTWQAQSETDRADDPTLPAEVAAKMGLRTAQADYPLEVVRDWFDFSQTQLDRPGLPHIREKVASYLLEGRTLGWLALTGKHTEEAPALSMDASIAFAQGEVSMRRAYLEGTPAHDPYEAMLLRHRTTHEAVAGIKPPKRVRQLLVSGVKAALSSRPEAAPRRFSREHAAFAGKQVLCNLANIPLVATMRYDHIPAVAQRRRQYAAR